MLEAVLYLPSPRVNAAVVALLLCLVELSGSLHTLGTLRWFPLATPKPDSMQVMATLGSFSRLSIHGS